MLSRRVYNRLTSIQDGSGLKCEQLSKGSTKTDLTPSPQDPKGDKKQPLVLAFSPRFIVNNYAAGTFPSCDMVSGLAIHNTEIIYEDAATTESSLDGSSGSILFCL